MQDRVRSDANAATDSDAGPTAGAGPNGAGADGTSRGGADPPGDGDAVADHDGTATGAAALSRALAAFDASVSDLEYYRDGEGTVLVTDGGDRMLAVTPTPAGSVVERRDPATVETAALEGIAGLAPGVRETPGDVARTRGD